MSASQKKDIDLNPFFLNKEQFTIFATSTDPVTGTGERAPHHATFNSITLGPSVRYGRATQRLSGLKNKRKRSLATKTKTLCEHGVNACAHAFRFGWHAAAVALLQFRRHDWRGVRWPRGHKQIYTPALLCVCECAEQ